MKQPRVIYTENLPFGVGGRCYYPWLPLIGTCTIKILPKYKDDVGLLKHEMKHVEQYYRRWDHAIKYMLDAEYRYQCELEAFTEQIREYNYKWFEKAGWIYQGLLNSYRLKVTPERVEADLRRIISENT